MEEEREKVETYEEMIHRTEYSNIDIKDWMYYTSNLKNFKKTLNWVHKLKILNEMRIDLLECKVDEESIHDIDNLMDHIAVAIIDSMNF